MDETYQDIGRQTFLSSSSLLLSLWLPQETDISWSLYRSSSVCMCVCVAEAIDLVSYCLLEPNDTICQGQSWLGSVPAWAQLLQMPCSVLPLLCFSGVHSRKEISQTEFTLWGKAASPLPHLNLSRKCHRKQPYAVLRFLETEAGRARQQAGFIWPRNPADFPLIVSPWQCWWNVMGAPGAFRSRRCLLQQAPGPLGSSRWLVVY